MKHLTPCQAIKHYCTNVCLQTPQEARKCENMECSLYRFRMGNNPNRKGFVSNIDQPRKSDSGKFFTARHGRKSILQTITDGRKRKDPKDGKFFRTEKVIHDREILIEGKYRLVRIDKGN